MEIKKLGVLIFTVITNNLIAHETILLFSGKEAFQFLKVNSSAKRIRMPYVPFRQATPNSGRLVEKLNIIAPIYEARNFKTLAPHKDFVIPPIIHQIWLGGPFPEKYQRYQKTIFDNHNGWLYKLWTDEDIKRLELYNKNFLIKACSLAEQANILRYEILDIFGGVYIDTDAELLKPLIPFHKRFDFYVGLEGFPTTRIGNAIIGACPDHPILKKTIKLIKNNWFEHTCKQHSPQLDRSGVVLWTKIILEEILLHQRATIFPHTYFYPWSRKGNRKKYIKPETFMVHDFDMTWSKRKKKST